MKMVSLQLRLGHIVGVVIVVLISFSVALEKPNGVSQEMYCTGCEVTVKELHRFLRHKPTRPLGETVNRALKRVCDAESFKNYEYNAETLMKVCKHIRNDVDVEMTLISQYGKKHELGVQSTYLDVAQQVCGTVLKACGSTVISGENEEDGGIVYDPVTGDFSVKPGKKVKTPRPLPPKETPQKEVPAEKVNFEQPAEDVPDLTDQTDQTRKIHSHDEF